MSGEERRPRHRYGLPLFPIIVIIVGVVLLLQTLGILSWGLWGYLWRFWPILIIIIGLNIILGRRFPWAVGAISLLLVLLAFGVAAWQAGPRQASAGVSGQFSEALGDFQSAAVQINFGAGELTLASLPQDSTDLVAGETRGPEEARLSLQLDRRDSEAGLELSFPQRGWSGVGNPSLGLELNLNPRIPLELNVNTGASSSDLNLSDLKVRSLDIKGGAARLEIAMPAAAGQTAVSISAGAADITIVIPEGVAARIKHTGLSSVDIDASRFPKAGDYNISPGYDTAANRIDIDITTAAASVRVR